MLPFLPKAFKLKTKEKQLIVALLAAFFTIFALIQIARAHEWKLENLSQRNRLGQTEEPLRHDVNKTEGQRKSKSNQGKEKRRYPTVLVIGSQKSGTTSLVKFLSFHPSIRTPLFESHFFDKYREKGTPYSWYLGHMPPSYPNQITMEKTPNYLTHKTSPKLVLQYQKFLKKKLKFILIVRDPIRRSISHAYHSKRHGRIKLKNLTDAILTTHILVDSSLYGKHFQKWLKYFPRSQFLILDGEKFAKNNPAPILRKVERFLKIRSIAKNSNFVYNNDKGFYCYKPKHYCFPSNRGHSEYSQKLTEAGKSKLKKIFTEDLTKFWSLTGLNFHWKLGADL
ncbi:heparan sulfate glucosamine 3-O-sulfotransferase 1-like [Convolutriloba macropyga]|uniref:heparan sulfate glucosamine 3-O-sulfotransferase 1-like n=1 Tax=Convolutriloba macropyga TaxID=536237 RepID=UPI003F51FBB7